MQCVIFCRLFLNKLKFYGHNLVRVPNTKFRENPASGSCADTFGRENPIVAFRSVFFFLTRRKI